MKTRFSVLGLLLAVSILATEASGSTISTFGLKGDALLNDPRFRAANESLTNFFFLQPVPQLPSTGEFPSGQGGTFVLELNGTTPILQSFDPGVISVEEGGINPFLIAFGTSVGVSDSSPSPVPEPSTLALLGAGLLGLGIFRKR